MVTKAQLKATAKYEKENYDRILIRLPKGTKEKIIQAAKDNGVSLNGFVSKAIEEKLK